MLKKQHQIVKGYGEAAKRFSPGFRRRTPGRHAVPGLTPDVSLPPQLPDRERLRFLRRHALAPGAARNGFEPHPFLSAEFLD
jgi:hypothetical protein